MEIGAAERALLRLLNDTESLRRLLRLYPQGHPGLQPARQRLASSAAALQAGKIVVLGVGPDRIFIDGEDCPLAEGVPSRRLAELLFRMGLAGMRLGPGAAADGLAGLAELLASIPDSPGEEERRRLLAHATALPGVELIALDLSRIQVRDEHAAAADGGAGRLMAELAKVLAAAGTYPLSGAVATGELAPGSVCRLLESSSTPETLLEHLFAGLAEVLREGPEARTVLLREVRAFLGELLSLLDAERRHLAMTIAMRHLPLWVEDDEAGPGPLVAASLVLDTVEAMLQRGYPVPDVARRAVERMGASLGDPEATLPDEVIIRAQLVASRLAAPQAAREAAPRVVATTAGNLDWSAEPWAEELRRSLEERSVHVELGRVLLEAATLWPREPVADAAAVRLAEELVTALEVGDFDAARRLAPAIVAAPSADAQETVKRAGTRAAIRALRSYGRDHHATVVGVLSALGEIVLPEALDALVTEESLTVRKRLLEAVLRQGEASIPLVRPLLRDGRWFVVRNAIFLLRRLGDRESLPVLRRQLPTAAPQVRAEILKALVALGDPQWATLLFREIDSGDPARVAPALAVAGRIRHPDVVQGLAARLRERIGLRVREPLALELIRILGRLRDPAGLPVLSEIVALRQWRVPVGLSPVRQEAARAIAALEGASAQAAARRLAGDHDPAVAAAAREALETPRPGAGEGELA
jgi:HEAT repeat protein